MADVTKEQVVDFLSKLTVMDIAALTKELEDKWERSDSTRLGGGDPLRRQNPHRAGNFIDAAPGL